MATQLKLKEPDLKTENETLIILRRDTLWWWRNNHFRSKKDDRCAIMMIVMTEWLLKPFQTNNIIRIKDLRTFFFSNMFSFEGKNTHR